MTSDQIEERHGPVVLECASKSKPGDKPYEVRRKAGRLSCNCKGWIFSRSVPKECKHTRTASGMLLSGELTVTEIVNNLQEYERKKAAARKIEEARRNSESSSTIKLLPPSGADGPTSQECLIADAILVRFRTLCMADRDRLIEVIRRFVPKVQATVATVATVEKEVMISGGVRRIVFDD